MKGRAIEAFLCGFLCTLLVPGLSGCGGDAADAPPEEKALAPIQGDVPGSSGALGQKSGAPDRTGMLRLEGGTFTYGPEQAYTHRVPARPATIGSFWIDAFEVTNGDFGAFVKATGFVTDAERIGNAAVFDPALGAAGQAPWVLVDGADWRHPLGPDSTIEGRDKHPVVQVSWNDAAAFAAWRGVRLPTDEEWEFAARGGLDDEPFPWGSTLEPGGRILANYWQGEFPRSNLGRDGFLGTAPVGRYDPNGYGLFDLAGNVWEWTAGGPATGSVPPPQSMAQTAAQLRSVRGGSYLCRERAVEPFHACRGYVVYSRQFKDVTDGNSNVGFRCAADS